MIKFDSENEIEFQAILEALNPGSFGPEEIYDLSFTYFKNPALFSHDNNCGFLFFNPELSWRMLWAYLINIPFGTIRDFSFYLNCKFPRAAWPLRLPLSLIMIWSQFPSEKWSPWFGKRIWYFLFYKNQDGFKFRRPLRFSYKIWYFTKSTPNDRVIEWNRYSLDSNLLNILRVSRLQMKWTAKVLDLISIFLYSNIRTGQLWDIFDFTWIYFKKDGNHPIVKASINKTYSSLIK